MVFVVDPWTARIQEYSNRLREYDDLDFLNSTVIVAANKADDETRARASDMEMAIRDTFANRVDDPRRLRWSSVSREQLEKDLREALLAVKKRIMERAAVKQEVEASRLFVNTVISGVDKD